jgi:hypothetical protein
MAVAERVQERLMTGEELLRRPDLGRCELVAGRVVQMAPTGFVHGDVESALSRRLEPILFTPLLLRGRMYLNLLRYPAPLLLDVR